MKYVDIAVRNIVAEDYVKKWMIILLRKEENKMSENNLTEEQKEFKELLQDLLMEQQEQM